MYIPFLLLLAYICPFRAAYVPSDPSHSEFHARLKRHVPSRSTIIEDDCSEDEHNYLRPMLYDIADVFRHAARASLPLYRGMGNYDTEKFFEFFGSTSYEARATARQKFDAAAAKARNGLNGVNRQNGPSRPNVLNGDSDLRIYCHAEHFPEDERECEEGSDFYKLYSRRHLNEIALCPGWWSLLPEYTGTGDQNDQISTLMLHLLVNLPYSETVSKEEYWESDRGFPEWDFYTTVIIYPRNQREAGLAQGVGMMFMRPDQRPLSESAYNPHRLEYMYFARSLWRREAVGPYRWHDQAWADNWVWLNGTEVREYPALPDPGRQFR